MVDGLTDPYRFWEGKRVSFVAFLHEAYRKIGPKRREELESLGFVMPQESFVQSWRAGASWGAAQARGTASVRVASEPVYKGAHTSYKT